MQKHGQQTEQLLRQTTFRYAFVLLFLALIAITNFLFVKQLAVSIQDDTRIIQQANEQQALILLSRVLIWRVAANPYGNVEEDRKELSLTIEQISENYESLLNDYKKQSPIETVDVILENPPYALTSRINEHVRSLEHFMEAKEEKAQLQQLNSIRRNVDKDIMIEALNSLINQITINSTEQKNKYNLFNWLNLVITLLLLIASVLFIFNPMQKSLQEFLTRLTEHQARLQKELEARQYAEALLQRREQHLNTIVETVLDGIISLDSIGRITFFNAAAERMFGYTAGEIIGKSIQIIIPSLFSDENTNRFSVARFLRSSERHSLLGIEHETKAVRKDGEPFSVTVAFDESKIDGETHFTGIVHDISELKESAKKLTELNQELQQSNQELEEFAVIASHDLQEPLRKVLAFSERLQKFYSPVLDERGTDYLTRMDNAAKRMQALISSLLTYSRVTTKAKPFEAISLNEVLQTVQEDLEVRIQETNATIQIEPLPIIQADPLQMRQLFQNLISNSLKFHKAEESPLVHIYAEHSNVPNQAIIVIEDNGIGIAEEHQAQIFKMFQRLHSRKEYEGSGVGLTVCRKILTRHGGRIEVESTKGEGSKFRLKMPVANIVEEPGNDKQPVAC